MLKSSSSWPHHSTLAPRRGSARLNSSRSMASVSGSRVGFSRLAALSVLGVAFGCTNEGRDFGGQVETLDASAGGDASVTSSGEKSTFSTTSDLSTTSQAVSSDVGAISAPLDSNESAAVETSTSREVTATDTTGATGATDVDTGVWSISEAASVSVASTTDTSSWRASTTSEATGETHGSTHSGASSEPAPTSEDPMSHGASSDIGPTSEDVPTDPTSTVDVVSSQGDTSSSDDFGVGQPPDYGNLGSGDGRLLVVNTLEGGASLDVWLADGTEPVVERLAPEAASRVTVARGAHRVVFTRHGTRDVVGCSTWFPLRGAEQWAVIPTGGEHTCSGSGDGSTLSFRQEQALDANPVRYVHATSPDSFSFTRNEQLEPGTLEGGETLSGTNLPNCTSGCEVNYQVFATGVADHRHFTLAVSTVEELPTAGEVMLLVLGNVRQDWPSEPDALHLLRVDLDGTTYVLRRDPEIAFGRVGYGIATFSISTPPSTSEVTSVDPYCGDDVCPLEVHTWRVGTRTFFVETPEGNADIEVEFEAGHRYVLLSTPNRSYPLYWLDADFDRSQTEAAYARAVNLDDSGGSLSFGYVFGSSAVAIDTLESVPWGEVSADYGGWVPAEEGWRLVTAADPDSLGTSCFYSVDTVPGFRGYFVAAETMQPLDITEWPPSLGSSFLICF